MNTIDTTAQSLDEVDRALCEADQQTQSEPSRSPDKKLSTLSAILRYVALVVLTTAAGSFLFQGWAGWNSAERILAFVAFNATLALTGVICGFRFKDDKGARVSLGIATAIIPVAFSQTGGLIYSLFASAPHGIPELLRFTAPSQMAVGLTAVAVLAILTPIAFAGFSVLARAEAPVLTLTYVFGNSVLLIPTRDSTWIGLLAMGLMAMVLAVDMTRFHSRAEIRTIEGTLARAMMFTPFGVLIGRNLALYSVSTILVSCVFAIATCFLFIVVPYVCENKEFAKLSQSLSTLTMGLSWICFARGLCFEYGSLLALSRDFEIPVNMLPISLFLTIMSLYTVGNGARYRRTAAYVAVGATMFELLTVPGMVSAFFCILTSIVCLVAGATLEERGLFKAGVVGLALGTLYHLRYAILIYHGLGPWISLAVLGIVVLLLSSYIERNQTRVIQMTMRFRAQMESWKR